MSIDVSGGYYLLAVIKPESGDSWVDVDGNDISALALASISKLSANPLPVYDFDLTVGSLVDEFDDFPLSPIQKMQDCSLTLSSPWSFSDGSANTPNILFYLRQVNSEAGKAFDVVGRVVEIYVVAGNYAGLAWDGTQWVCVWDSSVAYSALDYHDEPDEAEVYELKATYRIEGCAASNGKVTLDLTSKFGDASYGELVSYGGEKKNIKPITHGDFTDSPALVTLDDTLSLRTVVHMSEKSMTEFGGLVVYDSDNDRFWPVGSSLTVDSDNTQARFVSSESLGTTSEAHDADSDVWEMSSTEKGLVCPTYDDPAQNVYMVDDEYVSLHSPTGATQGVTLESDGPLGAIYVPPLVGRGFGGADKAAHATGAGYYLADSSLQENTVLLDCELYPVKIYDDSETNAVMDGTELDAYYQYVLNDELVWTSGDVGYQSHLNARLGGNPHEVMRYSKDFDGDAPSTPIVFSTSRKGFNYFNEVNGYSLERRYYGDAGHTQLVQQMTTRDLICEMGDLSSLNAELVSAKIYVDADVYSTLFEYNGDSDAGDVNAYGSSCSLRTSLDIFDSDGNKVSLCKYVDTVLHTVDVPYAHTISKTTAWEIPDATVESLAKIRIGMILGGYGCADIGMPYIVLRGIRLVVQVKVPISDSLKIMALTKGRAWLGTYSNMSRHVMSKFMTYGLGTENEFECSSSDGQAVGFSIVEKQSSVRDMLRDLALQGGIAARFKSGGMFEGVSWFSPASFGAGDTFEDGDVVHTDDGIADYEYQFPEASSVYSAIEIRYAYDYAREAYTRSILVNPDGWSVDDEVSGGFEVLSSATAAAMVARCASAQAWIGGDAWNTYTLDAAYIQDASSAEALAKALVVWLCSPRMSLSLGCRWDSARAQDAKLLSTWLVNVTGLPAETQEKEWVVASRSCELDGKTTIEFTELPSSV